MLYHSALSPILNWITAFFLYLAVTVSAPPLADIGEFKTANY